MRSVPRTSSSPISSTSYIDYAGRLYYQTDTSAATGARATSSYSYDLNSRLVGRSVTLAGAPPVVEGRTYAYDAAGQLTGTYGSGDGVNGTLGASATSYSFDGSGNRATNAATGATNTVTKNQVTSDGTYTYLYDNEGNLKTKTSSSQVTSYTWDYRNRLTEVQVKSSTGTVLSDEQYTYDALDRRIGVTTTTYTSGVATGTTSTWTAYNGSDPYADFNASGALTMRYLHAEATDAILARIGASGTLAWYITDMEGSVREVVDASGNILDRVSYDPFGQVTLESNPSQGDRFKYDGGAFSITTGLTYFNARYYDASRGVWIVSVLWTTSGNQRAAA